MRLIKINGGFVTNSSSINYVVLAGDGDEPLALGDRRPGPEDDAFLRDLCARLQAYFAQRFLDLLARPAKRDGEPAAPVIDPGELADLGHAVESVFRALKETRFWTDSHNSLVVELGDTSDWGGDQTFEGILYALGLDPARIFQL